MAEKHKSKYTAPKDLEKSQKPYLRKDIKDYTEEDKDGKMNPKSTGEKQQNVLRKTDKPVVDDGCLQYKMDDKNRLYKDLEDGDYDPKDAAKKMKKRQDDEEKDVEDVLKDKIENLTREQKERLVREYIRRKIVKVLREQSEVDPNAAPAEDPNAAPVEDPNATPAGDAGVDMTADPMAAMSSAPAPAAAPAMDTTTPPAPDTTTPAPTADQSETDVTQPDFDKLNKGGNVTKIKELAKIFNKLNDGVADEDKQSFYDLVGKLAEKMRNR